MPHVKEEKGGIIKVAPEPGLVQVEENTALVLRSPWSSTSWSDDVMTEGERRVALAHVRAGQPVDNRLFKGYTVKHEGWRLFIPGLVHDFVAIVPLAPRQEQEPIPLKVNVANGQAVDFNIRFSTVVGELNWRLWKVPLTQALEEPQWSDLCREPQQDQDGEKFILVRDPDDPFDKAHPYTTNDSAIIRAALRPENVWYEAQTAMSSALNEAAQSLGISQEAPLGVMAWLNQNGGTNRVELMEQVVVKANESLHRFGVVIFDVHLEGITLPEALERAVEQRQSAEQANLAADHLSSAVGKILKRGGMEKLPDSPAIGDRPAQAYLVARTLEALQAQSGVPSNRAPLISVTGDIASGNSLMGPAAGGSKGAPGGKKPGGAGRTK